MIAFIRIFREYVLWIINYKWNICAIADILVLGSILKKRYYEHYKNEMLYYKTNYKLSRHEKIKMHINDNTNCFYLFY